MGIWAIQESIDRNNEDCIRFEKSFDTYMFQFSALLFRYGPNGTETPPNDHDFYDHCQIVHNLQVNFKWGRKVHTWII